MMFTKWFVKEVFKVGSKLHLRGIKSLEFSSYIAAMVTSGSKKKKFVNKLI